MPSFNIEIIAKEVISLFAKYNIPIMLKDAVYREVDEQLTLQPVLPVDTQIKDQDPT